MPFTWRHGGSISPLISNSCAISWHKLDTREKRHSRLPTNSTGTASRISIYPGQALAISKCSRKCGSTITRSTAPVRVSCSAATYKKVWRRLLRQLGPPPTASRTMTRYPMPHSFAARTMVSWRLSSRRHCRLKRCTSRSSWRWKSVDGREYPRNCSTTCLSLSASLRPVCGLASTASSARSNSNSRDSETGTACSTTGSLPQEVFVSSMSVALPKVWGRCHRVLLSLRACCRVTRAGMTTAIATCWNPSTVATLKLISTTMLRLMKLRRLV
mmetsp:Transcript_42536/g.76268  ORF Transcript_42536/g.76268 Transcript_42536/m.76268 type:complete len:272 (+) Transcript_42536:435-1250(+)